ncbi:rhomboid-like protein [Mycolicibacterium sp. Dal123E01]|uniref:rhomboid-like protein n=1 Tax=Mycolicibacterium sp. Dal123E01 TaxID=3457578 RepID=UPI00403E611F
MHDDVEPPSPVLPTRRGWPVGVVHFIGTAPVTFTWLAVLFLTTIAQHVLPRWHLLEVLRKDSTNLHHLASDPIRVLITSLLWLDGAAWWPYLVMFCLFLAPAERWLGHLRFVIAGLIAHIVATYASEGYLYWQIQEALISPRYLNARDIGVSYFAVGIIGLLTYHIARPWRWLYLIIALAYCIGAVAISPMFTPVGHLIALFVGFACYPLARGRPGSPVDPLRLVSLWRFRHPPTPVQ